MTMGSGEQARQNLADALEAAGHQSPSGSDGIYGRSEAFELVIDGLARMIRAKEEGPRRRMFFPPLEPVAHFRKTDYLASFPQLTGSVDVFTGGDKEHKELLKVYETSDEWADELTPSGLMMVPATCHNVYPRYADQVIDEPVTLEARSWCFRHEPELDPMRMVCFRIYEQVYIGTAEGAQAHRDAWMKNYVEIFEALGLPVETDVANDPFFGRAGRILAVGQKSEALKFEVLTNIYDDRQTAIASGNAHRTHFGENFNITLPDGSLAHSACGGMGMERATIALMVRHGFDVEKWPTEVLSQLGM